MPRPLSEVRVIEFCSVAAGPFCGMLLADMGADVVKVENPKGGDGLRAWPPITDGFSENFASLNRNKRSVALDLKDADDRRRARSLVLSADVVLENNRPGVMRRLGLDYESFRAESPSLVYCSISAFGQDGPRSSEAGFDLPIQAMSGIMSVTGHSGAAPVKCGVPVSDFSTGLYAAFAITTALLSVRESGLGTHIDVSMLGASLAISALQTSEYFGSGRDPGQLGSAHPRNAPYQAFRASDGHFVMAAGNDSLWHATCHAIQRPELVSDVRFSTVASRSRNQDELRVILEEMFVEYTCVDLLELFRGVGVPCAPINTYSQALADPQVRHMGWVQEIELPSGARTRTFGSPLRFGDEGFPVDRQPPSLGMHNDELLGQPTAGTDR